MVPAHLRSHPLFAGARFGLMSGEKPKFVAQNEGGHEGLVKVLKAMGLRHQETHGRYGDPERSVIIYDPTREQMTQLGKAFGQESVVHSDGGRHQLIYTNGGHEGKFRATVDGHPSHEWFADAPKDDYTHIPGQGYFRINFDFDKEPQGQQPEVPAELMKRSKNVREQTRNLDRATQQRREIQYINRMGFDAKPGNQDKFGVGDDQRGLRWVPSRGSPLHELGHALQTPENSTLREFQQATGQPSTPQGKRSLSVQQHRDDEYRAFSMEGPMSRRAGVQPANAAAAKHWATREPARYAQMRQEAKDILGQWEMTGERQLDGPRVVNPHSRSLASIHASINLKAQLLGKSTELAKRSKNVREQLASVDEDTAKQRARAYAQRQGIKVLERPSNKYLRVPANMGTSSTEAAIQENDQVPLLHEVGHVLSMPEGRRADEHQEAMGRVFSPKQPEPEAGDDELLAQRLGVMAGRRAGVPPALADEHYTNIRYSTGKQPSSLVNSPSVHAQAVERQKLLDAGILGIKAGRMTRLSDIHARINARGMKKSEVELLKANEPHDANKMLADILQMQHGFSPDQNNGREFVPRKPFPGNVSRAEQLELLGHTGDAEDANAQMRRKQDFTGHPAEPSQAAGWPASGVASQEAWRNQSRESEKEYWNDPGISSPHSYPWHEGHTGHHLSQVEPAAMPVVKKNDQAAGAGVSSYARFAAPYGQLTPGQQTNLRFYPYQGRLPDIEKLVKKYGYQTYYAGGQYGKPDLARKNYNTGHLMIYDPSAGSGGDFGNEEYTRGWRQIHELAHALTYGDLNKIYGEGRRIGKLGVHRTPHEAQRAVHWEDLAVHKQRDLSKELGIHLSDEDFNRERNTVLHDALHRAVTGQFTEPGQEGFQPHSHHIPLSHAMDTIRGEAHALGLSDRHARLQKTTNPVFKRSKKLKKAIMDTPGSGLHSDLNSFMTGLKQTQGPARGKFITAHMSHPPFMAALQAHPQGKQIHAQLTGFLNSKANAGMAGPKQVVVKSEPAVISTTGNKMDYTPEEAAAILVKARDEKIAALENQLKELRAIELRKALIPPHKHDTGTTTGAGIEDVAPGKMNPPGKNDTRKALGSEGFRSAAGTKQATAALGTAPKPGQQAHVFSPSGKVSAAGRKQAQAVISPMGKDEASMEESSGTEETTVLGEETSTNEGALEKGAMCKSCGKAGDLCKCMGKAELVAEDGSRVSTRSSDSTLPGDEKSKKVDAKGSGGKITKSLKDIRKAAAPVLLNSELEKAAGGPPMAKPPSGTNMGTSVPASKPATAPKMTKDEPSEREPCRCELSRLPHNWSDDCFGPGQPDHAYAAERERKRDAKSKDSEKIAKEVKEMVVPKPAGGKSPKPVPGADHDIKDKGDKVAFVRKDEPQMAGKSRPGVFGRLDKAFGAIHVKPTTSIPALKPAGQKYHTVGGMGATGGGDKTASIATKPDAPGAMSDKTASLPSTATPNKQKK